MTNKTKRTILDLIAYAAGFVIAIGILVAWQLFDYRAALIVFSAACAAIAMCIAVYNQDELEDEEPPEEYEIRYLKCANCGETFEYHVSVNLTDEKKQEFQKLRRCPLCGGELEECDELQRKGDEMQ